MCDVLAKPGNSSPSRLLEVGHAGLEGPSLRTRLERKSADSWQLLVLNYLMVVGCRVATACTLLACGKTGYIKPQKKVAEVKHFSLHGGHGVRACAPTQLPWLSWGALIRCCFISLVLPLN